MKYREGNWCPIQTKHIIIHKTKHIIIHKAKHIIIHKAVEAFCVLFAPFLCLEYQQEDSSETFPQY